MMRSVRYVIVVCVLNLAITGLGQEGNQKEWKFDFGDGKVAKGFRAVLSADLYNAERGYGLLFRGAVEGVTNPTKDPLKSDGIASSSPFYFVLDIDEGNYRIDITTGNTKGSLMTVKAESRRLMLKDVVTKPGRFATYTFTVNVRTPRIHADESIRLKPREKNYLNWDDKLTLEFNGSRPVVNAIAITRVDDIPTVFLAGNSTVVDQEEEPWAAWGQMIPCFFTPDVVVANYAESGEALKSFVAEKRLDKILSVMKRGDYFFIEFAHNDQKPGSAHVDAFTTYKDELKHFINKARERGAYPVLVTSMHRRRFDDEGKIINTLEDYPEAMRQTAKEENVPLIDLNMMSKMFYESMGVEGSKKAFVHYPANSFPGQDQPLEDNTHFNNYGAYELARCIVEGIKSNVPQLAKHLRRDIPVFNPGNPDSMESVSIPASPGVNALVKPDGN